MEIIFGPPGTGKTTALLEIVAKELQSSTPPERIAYLSFTKKAALEAVERATKQFQLQKSRFVYFRTLHSLCFRQMGVSSSEVFDGKKILEFGKWLGVEVTGKINFEEGSTFGTQPGDRALFMVNLARLRQIPTKQLYMEDSDGLAWNFVDWIDRGLSEFKRHNDLIDYTDMLERFVKSAWKPDLDVVIVDEAQDLSLLQWEVVGRISDGARRVVVAGDDDQAIYRWAGADPRHMGLLRGTRRILDQSYRVPKSIQDIARGIISRTTGNVVKSWNARPVAGRISRVAKVSQTDLAGEDILILARNFSYLSDIQSELRNRGIPYSYRGTPAIPADIVSVIGDWERLRGGDRLDVDKVRKILSYMGSGMDQKFRKLPGLRGDIGIGELRASHGLNTDAIWHEALDKLPYQDKMFMLSARRNGEKLKAEPRVRLSTIHGSKGGQADHVIILSDMAPRTKREQVRNPDDEARVWYVGVTRAKEHLSIIYPQSSNFFNL